MLIQLLNLIFKILIQQKKIIPNNIKINENKKINSKKLNSMIIRYKIYEKDKKLRLFGEKFVENNKNNCTIIIDGKNQQLLEFINID